MKKLLKKEILCVYHYIDGKRIDGFPSYLRGNVTYLRGNVTGLRGNVTGLRGNVDECCLSHKDRLNGVDITELIMECA